MREHPAGVSPSVFASTGLQGPGERHRIVIVGGGAGGLDLAARLGDRLHRSREAEVLLIDGALTHVWKPLLHELAAGTLRHRETVVDFLQQARRHRFRFHLGSMDSLDRASQQLWLEPLVDEDGREIAGRRAVYYDTLVLAVGSIVNDFGTPGVREHSMALNGAEDAHRFHRRLLSECARAELQGDGPVEVVIVGGGATGVELAAELVESVGEIASFGEELQRLQQPVQVRIVEGGPRLLGALPEDVSARINDDMDRLGIDVLLGQRVVEVGKRFVRLGDGRTLRSTLTVWAAGIQGPPVLQQMDGLELNKMRQVLVRPTLQSTVDDRVFAIGDCAALAPSQGSAPVPPKAQAAQQQARFLADALPSVLRGQSLPAFEYHDKGSLVSLGHRNAVGSIASRMGGRSFTLEGWLARWSYWAVQRQHMAALHGVVRTAFTTLTEWLGGRAQPRVKLHL